MSVVRRGFWVVGLYLLSCAASAQAEMQVGPSAHDIVLDTSERVMAVVDEAMEYVDEDPERYFHQVHEILDPVIDYRGFARSIMGPYASSDRYRSLDTAGKAQLREELNRFTEVMRGGLVRTYGKGLLAFGGSKIEVSKPSVEEAAQSRVSVRQLIFSEESKPHVVLYQMGRNKAGEWKLRNVIIETVNLGEIYKNQFQAAARKHNGDLDAVISEWDAVAQGS